MGFLLKLSHLIDALSRFVGKTIIWLIFAATLISTANAVARKGFSIGSNAYLEVQWYLFAAVFMLGAGFTFMQNGHVRIDVLANRLSRKARMAVDIGGIALFLLPLCYFMIKFSWPIVERAYETKEMSSNAGGLIRWPLYALVPAGFGLLALQGISELIKRVAFIMGLGPDPLLVGGHESGDRADEPDAAITNSPADASATPETQK